MPKYRRRVNDIEKINKAIEDYNNNSISCTEICEKYDITYSSFVYHNYLKPKRQLLSTSRLDSDNTQTNISGGSFNQTSTSNNPPSRPKGEKTKKKTVKELQTLYDPFPFPSRGRGRRKIDENHELWKAVRQNSSTISPQLTTQKLGDLDLTMKEEKNGKSYVDLTMFYK